MRALALAACLLAGCDVVASVGDHDVGVDAPLADAPVHDAGLDSPVDDVPPHDVALDDVPPHDVPPHDGGVDAMTCHAADAGACSACHAANCCAALLACHAASPCPCLVDCILGGRTRAECETHCGGADHGEHDALVACSAASCSGMCP